MQFDPARWYGTDAEELRVIASEGTMRVWRCRGYGPPYYRLGNARRGKIVYRGCDLNSWLDGCRVEPAAA